MPYRLAAPLLAAPLAALALAAAAQPAPPRATSVPAVPPTASSPAAPKPDPAFEAARLAFETLPEPDRKALQDALVWTGDFNATASGTFGRRTYDAVLARQRRVGATPDGSLDERERAALLADGRRAKAAAGFAPRIDRATGVAIGVPAKLLPREEALPHGTRWQSADGKVTLETRAFAAGEADLDTTFDRVSASGPDRKVTYKLKRPDFLVVSGETGTGKFFIRYATTPAGLRGFTLGYDKASAAEIDRVVIAVANSFDPTPGAAPVAAVPPSRTDAPAAAGPGPTQGPPPLAGPAVMTALAVAPGRAVTSTAAFARCAEPRIGGAAPSVVARGERLVLLAAPAVRAAGVPSIGGAVEPGGTLVALAAAPDGRGLSVSPAAAVTAGRVSAPLQPGGAGAPLFNRAGALASLVADFPDAPRLVAGIVPLASYEAIPAAEVAAFLKAQGISLVAVDPTATGSRLSAGDIAAARGPGVVAVACRR